MLWMRERWKLVGIVWMMALVVGCSDGDSGAEGGVEYGPATGGGEVGPVGGEAGVAEGDNPAMASCEGFCGGLSPSGCSCVTGCAVDGGCCSDFNTECEAGDALTPGEGGAGNCVGLDLAGLDTCCDGGGHCLPAGSVPEGLEEVLAPCDAGGFCAPDDVLMATGSHVPKPCASLGGPGVCLSTCIPMVAEYAAILPQDVCAAEERCSPCINPLDGVDLGICDMELQCQEEGIAPEPEGENPTNGETFAECLGQPVETLVPCCDEGSAHCLLFPSGAELPPIVSMVEACPSGGYCVPDAVLHSKTSYTPKPCASIGGTAGSCLSTCIPKVGEFAALLPQDVCEADERCSPCVDPFTGEDTGGCGVLPLGCGDTLVGDEASCVGACGGMTASGCSCVAGCETTGTCCDDFVSACPAAPSSELSCENPPLEPVVDLSGFPVCCEGARCVPNALVPPGFMDKLDVCDGGSGHCIPDKYIETAGFFTDDVCSLPGGIEGRCLSTCLPDVAVQADLAPQATCKSSERCIPCCDPFTGEDLGFCGIGCDLGMEDGKTCEQDAVVYDTCCGEQGACLPTELIPPAFQENLKSKGCSEEQLCTPTDLLDPLFQPNTCESGPLLTLLLGIEYTGVCLAECIQVPMDFLLGKGSCDKGEQCIPCVDPLGGGPTGAPGCP